jgi:hypothetical protein
MYRSPLEYCIYSPPYCGGEILVDFLPLQAKQASPFFIKKMLFSFFPEIFSLGLLYTRGEITSFRVLLNSFLKESF